MSRTLVCEHCGEEFSPPDDETWNDDKALSELEQNFPDAKVEDCAIICDDCYKTIMRQ